MSARDRLRWTQQTTPPDLRPLLAELAGHYPVVRDDGSRSNVTFVRSDRPGICETSLREGKALVRYSSPAQAARAVGALLAGLGGGVASRFESTPFTMLGIMLDCSRNAVMSVDHVKLWMRRLALLGYNMLMLYTEDTYALPGEPWFGYQRGAYTAREIQNIDACAARLGIEVVPCIQTLGHLEKVLRHDAYRPVADTSSVLMVGEAKTYELIDKMIRHWGSLVRSRRIHIGMDETHDLGRGRYLDRKGYRSGFDLFNEHLGRVVSICRKHGLKPMIWSDMYFRLGNTRQEYYAEDTVIPRAVVRKIPASVELVYWDYYHADKDFYRDWIRRHRAMGKEPLMGSGIWTWNKYWHDRRLTEALAGPCIEACRDAGVHELFFTQWGDNGAFCDHDSAFAGMTWCADRAYGAPASEVDLEKRFAAVCGGSYAAHALASDIHGGVQRSRRELRPVFQPDLWDDPLFETRFRSWAGDSTSHMAGIARGYAALAARLRRHRRDRAAGDLDHAYRVACAFAERYALMARLLPAYRRRSTAALRAILDRIPSVVRSVRNAEQSFRRMWLAHNKPEGLETIQARFGMLVSRYREMALRIDELLRGKAEHIPELDYRCPPDTRG